MRETGMLAGRVTAVVLATTAIAFGAKYGFDRYPGVTRPAIPLAAAVWALFSVHHGYFAMRQIRWRHRRHVERARLAALAIPRDVPPPTAFEGVPDIDAAYRASLPVSPDLQGALFARGIKVAILPPLAVLIAATQNVLQPDRALAVGISVAEFTMMALMVGFVWRARNPSDRWVAARTRTELLRREQYLRLACVGPYHGRDRTGAQAVAAERIESIRCGPAGNLRRFVASRTDGRWWIDEFWRHPAEPPSDLVNRARCYLHYRLDKQILWFDLGWSGAHRAERQIARAIKVSLVTAMAVIAAQVGLRWVPVQAWLGGPWTADVDRVGGAASVLTLILPPLCAFLLAIQDLYSYRRLASSYEAMHAELLAARDELDSIIRAIETAATSTPVAGRQFQAAVLHVEDALVVELERWAMLTRRDEFDMSL